MPKNLPYADTYIAACQNTGCDIDTLFVRWINNVERHVFSILNLYLEDLADELYMVSFEKKISWKAMAKTVIDNNS